MSRFCTDSGTRRCCWCKYKHDNESHLGMSGKENRVMTTTIRVYCVYLKEISYNDQPTRDGDGTIVERLILTLRILILKLKHLLPCKYKKKMWDDCQ